MVIIRTQSARSVWTFENEWASGLCGCFGDLSTCCYAHWCCPCFMNRLFLRVYECPYIWCLPGGTTALRTEIRTGFHIRGGIPGDVCTMCFCPCCAAIQMYNELDAQGF